jgi:hypothetical protein
MLTFFVAKIHSFEIKRIAGGVRKKYISIFIILLFFHQLPSLVKDYSQELEYFTF